MDKPTPTSPWLFFARVRRRRDFRLCLLWVLIVCSLSFVGCLRDAMPHKHAEVQSTRAREIEAAVQNTLQRQASALYDFAVTKGASRARNPRHALTLDVSHGEARVGHEKTSTGRALKLGLTLTGVGRAGGIKPLPVLAHHTQGNRVEHDRGILTEWFVNGPVGLQQGFDVATRVEGQGPLQVVIAVDGLTPTLTYRGDVSLRQDGVEALSYNSLRAWDARGDRLATRMSVRDQQIVLEVEDERATYPIVIDPFVQQPKLTAPDAADWWEYGASVAISGNTAVIGTPGDRHHGAYSGSVQVLSWSGSAWVEQKKLIASSPLERASFGDSVAISGDTIVVGASIESREASRAGAAYVFVRKESDWVEEARLIPEDPVADAWFGSAVAIDGNVTVVGSIFSDEPQDRSGAAYVFKRVGNAWKQSQKLLPPDPQEGMTFGQALAISQGTILVGADRDRPDAEGAGAVYVFADVEGRFELASMLEASDPGKLNFFGSSLALKGNLAVIGAYFDGTDGMRPGAAYVFTRSSPAALFVQEVKLLAEDARHDARFGSSVSVDDDTVLIGALMDGNGTHAPGAAYVFVRSRNSWLQQSKLTASDGQDGDLFGSAVALSDLHALVSAGGRQDAGVKSGAVYPFRDVALTLGSPCRKGVECPSGFCVDGVCCNEACGGGQLGDCRACTSALTGRTTGTCQNVTRGRACGDPTHNTCNAADTCDTGGVCKANLALDGTVCEAGAFCSSGDACAAGVCKEGSAPKCRYVEKCDEAQDVCVLACGDGIPDAREQCDDGVLNSDTRSDACRTTCVMPRCGDGVVDTGEACDAGLSNSDALPNACRRNCKLAFCGDGVLDAGEGCDEGVRNSTAKEATCRPDCTRPRCGDGVRDEGEVCDDGAANSRTKPNACRPRCVAAYCGDGVVDDGEACDAGPSRSDTKPNTCRSTCEAPRCGDGVIDAGEGCDDGALNSDTKPDACRTRCYRARCGDGVVDRGEACDTSGPSALCDLACQQIPEKVMPASSSPSEDSEAEETPETSDPPSAMLPDASTPAAPAKSSEPPELDGEPPGPDAGQDVRSKTVSPGPTCSVSVSPRAGAFLELCAVVLAVSFWTRRRCSFRRREGNLRSQGHG